MKYYNIFIYFFINFLLHFLVNKCNSKKLKICLKYEQNESVREIAVNLNAVYLNDEIMAKNIRQNVKNGEQIDISMPETAKNGNKFDKFVIAFDIFVKPNENEYQSNGFDENQSDDQPFEDEYSDLKMNDIRSMARTINFTVYEPNLAKRYTFNLGQIDPSEQFWKRSIFLGTKNGETANFYGFLYAKVRKTQRNILLETENILLGHTSLEQVKKTDEEASTSNSQQHINRLPSEASTSQQSLTEFYLSISIDNAQRLFKHKILSLHLKIYQFNEKMQMNSDETEDECPICLEPLDNGKLTIKMHKHLNQNSKHIFHKHCILKWMVAQQNIFCPLCKIQHKPIMVSNFQPIFNGKNDEFKLLISSNPIGELIQMCNDDEFRRNQAKIIIEIFTKFFENQEKVLKNLVLKIDILNPEEFVDETLFKIGPQGYEESPILEKISQELEKFKENSEINSKKFYSIMAITIIKVVKEEKIFKFDTILENLQIICEE